jgi:thiamine biosynthesis lipoprotein
MLSVTILHPSAAWADALATGLYVMGIDRAIAYCEKHPETGMVAILPSKRQSDVEIVTCNVDEATWTTSN